MLIGTECALQDSTQLRYVHGRQPRRSTDLPLASLSNALHSNLNLISSTLYAFVERPVRAWVLCTPVPAGTPMRPGQWAGAHDAAQSQQSPAPPHCISLRSALPPRAQHTHGHARRWHTPPQQGSSRITAWPPSTSGWGPLMACGLCERLGTTKCWAPQGKPRTHAEGAFAQAQVDIYRKPCVEALAARQSTKQGGDCALFVGCCTRHAAVAGILGSNNDQRDTGV